MNLLSCLLGKRCLEGPPPLDLEQSRLVADAWQGLDPHQMWDVHAHLAGVGDGGSGIWVHPRMQNLGHLSPLSMLMLRLYQRAGCTHLAPGRQDHAYWQRLESLVDAFPPGVKIILLAFDYFYREDGCCDPMAGTFYVPNEWARQLAAKRPDRFGWMASIHPYDPYWEKKLHLISQWQPGPLAIKWLPQSMGIQPDSARCFGFYQALAQLNLPLLTHCGDEKATHGDAPADWNAPSRLAMALDTGVRVIVAHCASLGGAKGKQDKMGYFGEFMTMMDNPRWKNLLFGDISATLLVNRRPEILPTLLSRVDLHPRLLYGSDYPLPAACFISVAQQLQRGLIHKKQAEILQQILPYNPLLFHFLLVRWLNYQGIGFSPQVFHTDRFFSPFKN
ncbi:MAG: amidohydrolase family protein [Magnetococcales bacterium]|nr:amidohydrolase family protein [Magnetococcales bacterium]NGZ28536.1 amidohydrolase family protein [Magnetococcales bacterium]